MMIAIRHHGNRCDLINWLIVNPHFFTLGWGNCRAKWKPKQLRPSCRFIHIQTLVEKRHKVLKIIPFDSAKLGSRKHSSCVLASSSLNQTSLEEVVNSQTTLLQQLTTLLVFALMRLLLLTSFTTSLISFHLESISVVYEWKLVKFHSLLVVVMTSCWGWSSLFHLDELTKTQIEIQISTWQELPRPFFYIK